MVANEENSEQVISRMTAAEKRAMRMLAGALGLSIAGWTRETLREKWEEKFPDMEYPDERGEIKPKRKRQL